MSAKIIAATLDHTLHTGAGMEYQALPPRDVFMATTSDVVVEELNEALGRGTQIALAANAQPPSARSRPTVR